MKQSDHQDLDKQLSEIIDYCAESYYPEHEYGDIWEDRNAEYLKDAVEQIKSLIQSQLQKAVREARIDELKQIMPPEQYEDYAKLMGDEMCHICGFNACKFRRLLQERINQLNGDK